MGDRFGRKRTLIVYSLVEVISGIGTSLSPNYVWFVLFRCAMAVGNAGKAITATVLLVELTTAKYRSTFVSLLQIGTTFLFRAMLALWAYYIPNWRLLNGVTLSPAVLSVLYFWFLPESPRWLVSQGRPDEAICVLQTGFKVNHPRCSLDERLEHLYAKTTHMMNYLQVDSVATGRGHVLTSCIANWMKPFSSGKHLRRIIFGFVLYTGIFTSFFGLLMYASKVSNYVYLVAFLNSLTSVPSNILLLVVYRCFEYRKRPIVCFLSLASFFLAIIVVYLIWANPETDMLLTICTNIALIFLTTCVSMCSVYLSELFPSEMRTQAFGAIIGFARLCTMSSSFINTLDKHVFHGCPVIVYFGFTAVGLLDLALMPETSGVNLPDVEPAVKGSKSGQAASDV